MECYLCTRELKVDDVTQEVYVTHKVPDRLRQFVGWYMYMEASLIHFDCGDPTLEQRKIGRLARQAAERDYEKRIKKDNSPDAIYIRPGGGSKTAMDYVQEHYESKAE